MPCLLTGAYFCEAFDALLSRLPFLSSLHMGNNQLSSSQIEGIAASFARYKMASLDNLTLGSNEAGDRGELPLPPTPIIVQRSPTTTMVPQE